MVTEEMEAPTAVAAVVVQDTIQMEDITLQRVAREEMDVIQEELQLLILLEGEEEDILPQETA